MKKQRDTRNTKTMKKQKGIRRPRKTRKLYTNMLKKTRKLTGGDGNDRTPLDKFRKGIQDYISQIKNKKNTKKIKKDGITRLIQLLRDERNRDFINKGILINANRVPVDKMTQPKDAKAIGVVPIVVAIFDNLTNEISRDELIAILNAYYNNGGLMNEAIFHSSIKQTPLEREMEMERINNIRLLFDETQIFHLDRNALDASTEQELQNMGVFIDIMPSPPEPPTPPPEPAQLDFTLPLDISTGYDPNEIPEFWKPIFDPESGDDLMTLREKIRRNTIFFGPEFEKRGYPLCAWLQSMIPNYFIRNFREHYNEQDKTIINTNVLHCLITILYAIISYRLFITRQNYVILFKGGRALQIGTSSIKDTQPYHSGDTDISIIPNEEVHANYLREDMEKMSIHLAYLVKWFIQVDNTTAPDFQIIVSLPGSSTNKYTEITKLVYNEGRAYKALSDIGFGKIESKVQEFFDFYNLKVLESPLDELGTTLRFVYPSIEDMLNEKLYYYAENFVENMKPEYANDYQRKAEIGNTLYKFNRAIQPLIKARLMEDGATESVENKRALIRSIITRFSKFSEEEINLIVNSLSNK